MTMASCSFKTKVELADTDKIFNFFFFFWEGADGRTVNILSGSLLAGR